MTLHPAECATTAEPSPGMVDDALDRQAVESPQRTPAARTSGSSSSSLASSKAPVEQPVRDQDVVRVRPHGAGLVEHVQLSGQVQRVQVGLGP